MSENINSVLVIFMIAQSGPVKTGKFTDGVFILLRQTASALWFSIKWLQMMVNLAYLSSTDPTNSGNMLIDFPDVNFQLCGWWLDNWKDYWQDIVSHKLPQGQKWCLCYLQNQHTYITLNAVRWKSADVRMVGMETFTQLIVLHPFARRNIRNPNRAMGWSSIATLQLWEWIIVRCFHNDRIDSVSVWQHVWTKVWSSLVTLMKCSWLDLSPVWNFLFPS